MTPTNKPMEWDILLMIPPIYGEYMPALYAIKAACEYGNIGFGGGTSSNGDKSLHVLFASNTYPKIKELCDVLNKVGTPVRAVLSIVPKKVDKLHPVRIVDGTLAVSDMMFALEVTGKSIDESTHPNFDQVLKNTKALIRKRHARDKELDAFLESIGGARSE